jgi:hypothetical protein
MELLERWPKAVIAEQEQQVKELRVKLGDTDDDVEVEEDVRDRDRYPV